MSNVNIATLVEAFAKQIMATTEAAAEERIQATLSAVFGAPAKRGPGRPPKQAALATPAAAVKPTAVKKLKKASPKVARAQKLQGQYLGALRSLSASDRAKVKAVAKAKSVAEAVKLALSLKKKT